MDTTEHNMSADLDSAALLRLDSAEAAVTALVMSSRGPAGGELRAAGYSRLARLLEALTCDSAPALEELCLASLPAARGALGLSAALSVFAHARARRYSASVRSADIGLTLLGAVDGLLSVISVVEVHISRGSISMSTPKPRTVSVQPGVRAGNVPVEDAHKLSKAEFDARYFQRDVPVVLHKAAPDVRWADAQWLAAAHGHRTVPIEVQSGTETKSERFETLAQLLTDEGDEVKYLAQHPLLDYIPELRADMRAPTFVHGDPRIINVWMGTAGSGSALHYDTYDNFLVQLSGVKVVVLVPASAPRSAMYIRKGTANVSAVDPRLTADELTRRFPKFAALPGVQVCTLRHGDALYIPSGHWHWVCSETRSISVNFWFT